MLINADFLVIGAGPAGVCAADILSKSGKKVVITGKDIGGAYCAEGSVVSNSLLRFSLMYEKYRQVAAGFIEGAPLPGKPDFRKLTKYVESNVNKAKKLFSEALEKNRVEFIEGVAQFVSPHEAQIKDRDGNEIFCQFGKCLIAVGSGNQKLGGVSGKKSLDVSSFAGLESVPPRVSVIGGGFVGTEIATFFSRLGSKVTIVEKNCRLLADIDPYIVKKYEDYLKKREINVVANKNITKIERVGQKYIVLFEDSQLESEEVFLCIGRTPLISGLNLEAAGVSVANGVPVFSENLKTANDDIFVAGDVTNLLMHTSWAYYSASIAARNMLGNDIRYSIDIAPIIASVDPEIACVGLSEEEAKESGFDVGVIKYTCGDIYGFPLSAGAQTYIKAVYNKTDKTFLGAQVMGYGAGDMISTLALMIQLSVPKDRMPDFIYARPVFNEFFNEVAEKIK